MPLTAKTSEGIRRRSEAAKNTFEDILERLVPHWTGCILWVGSCSTGKDGGYGWVKWHGKFTRVHRLVYEQTYGPIPDGLFVLHKCDVRNCANPDHLFLGTGKDNMQDMIKKGRAPFQVGTHREKYRNHCVNGHEYTPDNTAFRAKANGGKARVCVKCRHIRWEKWYYSKGHLCRD